METIKGYLEAMFAGMPNTPEVRKAKSELLQMMEDKYNELIEEGTSENSAVGTVISEFGNLDELADDLGLKKEVEEAHGKESETPRRHITLDEVKDFIINRRKKALFQALGVMLCIISVTAPIMLDVFGAGDLGAALMFVFVGAGVGSLIYCGFVDSNWKFMNNSPCQIDMNTAKYVKEARNSFEAVRAICITLGTVLCVICWVPCIIIDYYKVNENLGGVLIFLLVGIGVFLIIYSNKIASGYDKLLELNDKTTFSGTYVDSDSKPVNDIKYKNKTAETIVALYWPTVTCLYLILSFLTFQWGITWIIWVIAGVAHKAVVINCQADDYE